MSAREKRNPLVIYHADCVDGFTSAWIAWRALDGAVELRAAAYGQPAPCREDLMGRDVYVLDFSYPREEMCRVIRDVSAGGGKFICLDHHETARTALCDHLRDDLLDIASEWRVMFGYDISGAMMTWTHFYGPRSGDLRLGYQLAVRVSDSDTGQRKLPHAREFNALIGSYPFDLQAYTELAGRMVWTEDVNGTRYDDVVCAGRDILREKGKRQDIMVGMARRVVLAGVDAYAVNCSDRSCFTAIGMELARRSGVGACYYVRADGVVEWSLRSLREEEAGVYGSTSVSVADLAKKMGGGGHKHAAGFTQTVEQLAQTLQGDS